MKPCKFVYESIRFDINAICSCCNNVRGIYIPIDTHSKINEVMTTYFDKTNYIANGIDTENECEGCYKLTDEYMNSHPQQLFPNNIKTIYICHWRYCNLNCVYCVYKNEKKNKNNYNVVPYLKWLEKNNKLAKDFQIAFGGGEPGILKEIDKILDWARHNTNSYISVMTNMIVWRNSYKKLLENGQLILLCSLDSGNNQLYKTIHEVDCFDKVIDNIKTAVKYAKNDNQIHLKYILLENYNDKQEYIDEFIHLAEKLGVYMIHFDFDRSYYNVNKPIPEHLLNLYQYAKSETQKNNLNLILDERTEYSYNHKIFT